ncbi:MAG: TonB-dependent siderophore receptor, partial [Pseudomonadota bacterium]
MKASTLDLPAQTVIGTQEDQQQVTAGSKVPLKLREVPQTVNVVGQQRIEEQNLYTLEQAMKQVGGVTVQRIDANRMSFFSRGFEMNSLQLDGTPTTLDNRIFLSPDLAMYERVEVLKGPAGILNGSGGAGGSINLVRKRPQTEAAVSGELSAGSWDDYRGMIDVTGPLTDSGNIRGRAVASRRDRGFHYDGGDEQSALFYGVLEADLTPDTLLTLGASHQEVDARGAQRSLPAYLTTTDKGDYELSLVDVSRSNFYGADWNRDYFWSDSAFAELEQQWGNGWLTKLSLRHAQNNYDLTQAYARNGMGIDPANDLVDLNAVRFDYREEQNEVDAYVDGPFSLFGREHKLLVGANYSQSEFHNNGNANAEFLGEVDLFDPHNGFVQPAFTKQEDILSDTRQRGLYSNLRLSLADPLTLVLGGRMSWWDIDRNLTAVGGPTEKQTQKIDREFTPFVGLVYEVSPDYSLYASYAEVFQPQSVTIRDINDRALDPLQGEQWEAGVKGEYLDGAVTASFALFQIEELNRDIADLNDPEGNASVASGKTRSRGFETELNGQLTADWTLNA